MVIGNDHVTGASFTSGSFSSYLCDRAAVRSGAGTPQVPCTAVRSGADIGLRSLRPSVSQDISLGDFLLAPAFPIEKVTLCVGFLYLTSGSETDESVAKDKVFARAGNRTRDQGLVRHSLEYRFTPVT